MSFLVSFARSFIVPRRTTQKSFNLSRKMATTIHMPRDPNTLSNYNNWITKHTKAEFTIDFDAQKLHGNVTLDLESITASESEEIILDSSYLDIKDISLNGIQMKDWVVKDRFEPYGSPLSIKVPGGKPKGDVVNVKIALSTTSKCTALQWLTPAQTKGEHPYMFSQCQAIHNRSLFPCQDTPDVKSTYEFRISSPLPVIASGVPVQGSLKSAEQREDEKLHLENRREAQLPERSTSDSLKCGRCGQKQISFSQTQTGSADEPMTTFCACSVCGNMWKMSAPKEDKPPPRQVEGEDRLRASGQPLPVDENKLRTSARDSKSLTEYRFTQEIPMPSYLFALASGDIVSAPIGPRSVVATTPGEDLANAKWELEKDTEKFIQTAESLIFPYVWGQYNVLVLPASFPYGKFMPNYPNVILFNAL
jgi:aminopeptidase N